MSERNSFTSDNLPIPRFGDAADAGSRVDTRVYRFPESTSASAAVNDGDLAVRLAAAEERARLAEQALVVQQGQVALSLQMLVEAKTLNRDLQRDCDDLRREMIEYRIKLVQKDVLIADLAAAGYQIEADRLDRALADVRAKFEAAMAAPAVESDDETRVVIVG